jgi:hypothetical protein
MNVFKLIEDNGLNLHGDIEHFAELVAAAEREKVAAWMIKKGYATGHGDSVEDLLQELDWQIREQEREACAKVCDNRITNEAGMQREDYENRQCAAAIRARGNSETH